MGKSWRLLLIVTIGLTLAAPLALTIPAKGDEVTISQNVSRDGWDPNEPGLSPGIVQSPSFGKLFATSVSGQIFAQPIVVGNTVVVATETDDVYGLNAQTGAIIWHTDLGPPWPSAVNGCADLTPSLGVTSTPVYDPSSGEVYLAGVVNNGPNLYQPNVTLFALNVTNGQIAWQVPMRGAPVNDPTEPFDPLTERQRASLLLENGEIFLGFSSYCDFKPYTGLVAGVNTTTHALTMWTDESGATDNQGGIWMGGGGVAADGSGHLYVTSGNGVSAPAQPGANPPPQLGDATVQLGVQTDGSLVADDFFSPVDAPTLDSTDQDFGSGGPVLLPFGTPTYPNLLVQSGKDGRVFILNQANLGGRGSTTDHAVSTNGPYQGQWGHPAAFAGANGQDYIYYLGKADNLRALRFNTSTGALTDAFNSPGTFPYGSGSPVVTSNGNDPSSAVVWAVNRNSSNSTLDAFAAVPSSGKTLTPLWSAPIGTAAKFTTPATDSGRVYVGTADGVVYGFGSPDSAPLTSPQGSFQQTPVGSSPTLTVTVTATATVTVTGVSTSATTPADPYTAGTPSGPGGSSTFPMTLNTGQTLSVPVTFAPTAPGGVTGELNFATNTQNFSNVSVPLSGTATQTGFYASPATLAFGVEPIGASMTAQTVITNGGTGTETWSPVTAPADSAFTVTGQPAAGTQIAPGQSATLNVTYTPTVTTGDSASFSEASSLGGTTATVSLNGTGVPGQGMLKPSMTSVAFNSVALGQQASQTVDITNSGNLPVTVTGFTAPGVPFGTPVPVPKDITLSSGSDVTLPITFTPQSKSATSGSYTLTATDGHNPPQTLTIPVSGTGVAPPSGISVPSPGGGWRLNGNAKMAGTTLQLTAAANNQKGSAVYYQPLASDGLTAHFTTHIGGGSGADGLTFSLLDASEATTSSLGFGGGYLGFGTLPGISVTLSTYPKDMVGIATGANSSGLRYAATNTHVPDLRSGKHVVAVSVTGSAPSTVTVKIDGTQYLSTRVNVPAQVLAAFTGSTGGLNDLHAVSAESIVSGSTVLPVPGGSWCYNGHAIVAGTDTQLTQAVKSQAGAVIYPTPVTTNGLQVTFNMQIGGGTGADGMTFALLNPTVPATSVGGGGSELGFGGLSGVAAVFDTHQTGNYPSSNFAGVATGVASVGQLKFDGTVSEIAPLRTGTHQIVIAVTGNVLSVYDDGVLILQRAESIPSKALLAFTGADGALTDVHALRDVAISAP
jgi:hypothetical protein